LVYKIMPTNPTVRVREVSMGGMGNKPGTYSLDLTAGDAGDIIISGNPGGGTSTGTAGDGGDYEIFGGAGGSGGSTGTGGNGGASILEAGDGGDCTAAGSGGNGGVVRLIPGSAGTTTGGTDGTDGHIKMEGMVVNNNSATDIVAGNFTVAALRAGIVLLQGAGGNHELPDLTDIVSGIPGIAAGDVIEFYVINTGAGGAATIIDAAAEAGTVNVALTAGSNVVPDVASVKFGLKITDLTAGAEIATLYRLAGCESWMP
jgi:hypothetical protein